MATVQQRAPRVGHDKKLALFSTTPRLELRVRRFHAIDFFVHALRCHAAGEGRAIDFLETDQHDWSRGMFSGTKLVADIQLQPTDGIAAWLLKLEDKMLGGPGYVLADLGFAFGHDGDQITARVTAVLIETAS